MKNPQMLDTTFSQTIPYADSNIYLSRDDSKPMVRYIISTAKVGGIQRTVRIGYTANVPQAYRNSLSSQGNINITGKSASFILNDQTCISGKVIDKSKLGIHLFENLKTNQDLSLTSLTYPNVDPSEDPYGIENFIKNNKDLIAGYNSNVVLYVKSDYYTLPIDGSLSGKKIIYVEGDAGAAVNVIIPSNNVVAQNQNLTIITPGIVTFHQSGLQAPSSQLNIIAWGGYNETVSAISRHQGIIYTHGTATFDQINASSVNNGSVIADGGIVIGEIWSTKIFNYSDITNNGSYPPGFERLTGASIMSISGYPISWEDISN
ncbi:MAG: hypothetical protein HQL14_04910 [Candidatus Omnitrophica bacterium]|nr:hypothetical protein [Candidatus Omnitrophota bacterium]